jgi:hypothetical protein
MMICMYDESLDRATVLKLTYAFTMQILDTPSLLADASSGAKKNIFKQKAPEADGAASGCC